MRIECSSRGQVSVLQQIGGKREKAANRGFEAFFGWQGDKVEAEELVCMCKIIRCKKNSCFTSRPA